VRFREVPGGFPFFNRPRRLSWGDGFGIATDPYPLQPSVRLPLLQLPVRPYGYGRAPPSPFAGPPYPGDPNRERARYVMRRSTVTFLLARLALQLLHGRKLFI